MNQGVLPELNRYARVETIVEWDYSIHIFCSCEFNDEESVVHKLKNFTENV